MFQGEENDHLCSILLVNQTRQLIINGVVGIKLDCRGLKREWKERNWRQVQITLSGIFLYQGEQRIEALTSIGYEVKRDLFFSKIREIAFVIVY